MLGKLSHYITINWSLGCEMIWSSVWFFLYFIYNIRFNISRIFIILFNKAKKEKTIFFASFFPLLFCKTFKHRISDSDTETRFAKTTLNFMTSEEINACFYHFLWTLLLNHENSYNFSSRLKHEVSRGISLY